MAKIKIPLADPSWEYRSLQNEIDSVVKKVLEEGKFILGPEVELFEKEASEYLCAKYAIGMSSGTDALLASLMAIGVKEGDEVITTSFSFIATASVIARVGAKPVFVDVEEDGFNMDPDGIKRAITKKTKAIIVVHIFGEPARLEEINKIAQNNGIKIIEDCAQAFGAKIGSRKVGTFGDIGCYSFFPAKPLGCAGDGGLVITNDENLATILRMMRVQGASGKNLHKFVGGNFRLDTIQAAILKVKLNHIDSWLEKRGLLAGKYLEKLAPLEKSGKITLPKCRQETRSSWAQFSILAKNRDKLKNYLLENGIGCEVYYPIPLFRQECMAQFYDKTYEKYERVEKVCREVLSIPVHQSISIEHIEEVSQRIIEFYE